MLTYYLDCLDGITARVYKLESRFGDILDHTRDVVGFVSLLIYLQYRLHFCFWICTVALYIHTVQCVAILKLFILCTIEKEQ